MIEIDVYIEHVQHGVRHWPAVPRVGETMIVTLDEHVHYLKVVEVQWGITPQSRRVPGDCVVAVFCQKKARKK